MSAHVTSSFASFAANCRWSDLPPVTQYQAVRTLVNSLALGVGAAHHPAVERTLATLTPLGSPPDAAVLGRPERLGAMYAPLVNGLAMHVEDYDDTHLPTVVHPGAPIVPAILAVAEVNQSDGQDVLAGIVAGIEVALRLADAMCPEHFDRGWHVTGTAGHVGAAAGAARTLGLDAEATHRAIALGATQASGLTAALGTMTKAFHPGKAAADGVEAAMYARAGFTGPAEPIVGRRGLAPLASSRVDEEQMLTDRWILDANALKPYACGVVSHAAIDAAVSLRDAVGDEDAEAVEVVVNPVVLDVMGVEDPDNGLQAKFSVYHCVAVGLLDGDAGPAQFSDARARAPEVVDLRSRVRVVLDKEVPKGAAHLSVRTVSGRQLNSAVANATGSVDAPMTEEQLRRKVQGLTQGVLGPGSAEVLFERCEDLASGGTIDDLLAALSPNRSLMAHEG